MSKASQEKTTEGFIKFFSGSANVITITSRWLNIPFFRLKWESHHFQMIPSFLISVRTFPFDRHHVSGMSVRHCRNFFRFNLFYSASNMFRHQVLIICKHPDQSELIGLFFTQILLALAQTIFKFFRRKTSKGDRRHSELEDIEARGRVLWQLNFNFKTTFLKSYVLRGILR